MKYLVTSEEMKEYDTNTINRLGVPALVLMERAALAVRDEILRLLGDSVKSKEVLIAVGSGNNGADGLALARLLAESGFGVSVYEGGDSQKATDAYRKQKEILYFYEVDFLEDKDFAKNRYDFVVDSIFGVGLSRKIGDSYAEVIEWLNRLGGFKIAVDLPSGVDGTTGKVLGCAFHADLTVTFGFGKRGLYLYPGAEYAGKIVIAQIGIDEHSFFERKPAMFTYDEPPQKLMPARKRDGNKGTFGKVLLVAGWENMAGAAIMCAKAILHTGAGMVKIFCSEQNREILQCAVAEGMYGSRKTLREDLKWADVIVAGPGLGKSDEAKAVLEEIIEGTRNTGKKILWDADALNLFAESSELRRLLQKCKTESEIDHHNEQSRSTGKCRFVLTPHMGELARLSGFDISYLKSHVEEVAKAMALDYDSVMVCKDARTIVYGNGRPVYLNLTGNSGMATAGSGDVLAGIVGALLAQGCEAFEAACTGVYLHGLAGDLAAGKYTEYGVTATGITAQIEAIMKGS